MATGARLPGVRAPSRTPIGANKVPPRLRLRRYAMPSAPRGGAIRGLFGRDCQVLRFAVTPPGRHHRLPLGGDQDADEGARGGGLGALAGAALGGALGAVAGLVASPLVGPVAIAGGLAAGAYAGSLAGAMRSLGSPVEKGTANNVVRQAGMMVAVHVGSADEENTAIDVLRASKA